MIYYRVSRKAYKIGENIWEAEIGKDALTNILLCLGFFATNNNVALSNMALIVDPSVRGAAATAAREAALEFERQRNFLSLPCRYQNMMVFSELTDAKFFKESFRKNGTIYGVHISGEPKFTGDMRMIDSVKKVADWNIDSLLGMAQRYWVGKKTEDPIMETILDSALSASIAEEISGDQSITYELHEPKS